MRGFEYIHAQSWPIYRTAVEWRLRILERLKQYIAGGGLMNPDAWHTTRVEAAYNARNMAYAVGWNYPNIVEIDRKIHDKKVAILWGAQ